MKKFLRIIEITVIKYIYNCITGHENFIKLVSSIMNHDSGS